MVSAMSAISRRISGWVGSSTGSASRSRTGWPMRAIFRMGMGGLRHCLLTDREIGWHPAAGEGFQSGFEPC